MVSESSSTRTLRVVSYNIHKGRNLLGVKNVVAAMRHALEKVDADIVLLQEVQGFLAALPKRSRGKKIKPGKTKIEDQQLEYFADSLWPHYAYGQNASYDAGHHGNAILSKYPIRESRNIDISCRPWEERGILHAVVDVSSMLGPHAQNHPALASGLLNVFSTHFGLFEVFRKKQSLALCDLVMSELGAQRSFLLGGDFNDWRRTLTKHLTAKLSCREVFTDMQGQPAPTFPATRPFLALDRIYVRGFKAIEVQVLGGEPWTRLSDHAPLYCELEIEGDAHTLNRASRSDRA